MEYLTSTKTEPELTKVYNRAMTYRWQQGDAEKINHCLLSCLIRLNHWEYRDGKLYNKAGVEMAIVNKDEASGKITLEPQFPRHRMTSIPLPNLLPEDVQAIVQTAQGAMLLTDSALYLHVPERDRPAADQDRRSQSGSKRSTPS